MKILLLYAVCALISGGKGLVFALPMTYFCFAALSECGVKPCTEIEDNPRAGFARSFEAAVRCASLVSCGFLLSELLAAVSIAMRSVAPQRGISFEYAALITFFPVAMYLLTLGVSFVALSHIRRARSETVINRIRTVAPLAVIAVGAVLLRGMQVVK